MAGLFDDLPNEGQAPAAPKPGMFDDVPAATANEQAAKNWGPWLNTADAATLGGGRKIMAGVQAAKAWMHGLPAGEAYNQALDHYGQAEDAWNAENPKMGIATSVAGSLPIAAAIGAVAPAGILGGALTGGAMGASHGALSNDGSASDKLAAAAREGGLGAAGGAAAEPIASLAAKPLGWAAQKVANVLFNRTNGAGLTTSSADALGGVLLGKGRPQPTRSRQRRN